MWPFGNRKKEPSVQEYHDSLAAWAQTLPPIALGEICDVCGASHWRLTLVNTEFVPRIYSVSRRRLPRCCWHVEQTCMECGRTISKRPNFNKGKESCD